MRVLAVLALVIGSLLLVTTASAAIPPGGPDDRCAAHFDNGRAAAADCWPGGSGPMVTARASASADPDSAAVLAAQNVPAGLLIGSAVLLMVGAVLAATLGSRLLRP